MHALDRRGFGGNSALWLWLLWSTSALVLVGIVLFFSSMWWSLMLLDDILWKPLYCSTHKNCKNSWKQLEQWSFLSNSTHDLLGFPAPWWMRSHGTHLRNHFTCADWTVNKLSWVVQRQSSSPPALPWSPLEASTDFFNPPRGLNIACVCWLERAKFRLVATGSDDSSMKAIPHKKKGRVYRIQELVVFTTFPVHNFVNHFKICDNFIFLLQG